MDTLFYPKSTTHNFVFVGGFSLFIYIYLAKDSNKFYSMQLLYISNLHSFIYLPFHLLYSSFKGESGGAYLKGTHHKGFGGGGGGGGGGWLFLGIYDLPRFQLMTSLFHSTILGSR